MIVKLLIRFTFLVLLAGTAVAVDMNWTNAAGGDWTDPDNWDTAVPGLGDYAVFNMGSATAYTVSNVTDGTSNGRLKVEQDKVKLDLTGITYNLTVTTVMIVRGPENTTTLEIVGGTVQIPYKNIYAGYSSSAPGWGTLIFNDVTFTNTDPDESPIGQLRIGSPGGGSGTVIMRGGTELTQDWGIRKVFMYTPGRLIIEDSGTDVQIGDIGMGLDASGDASLSMLIVTNGARLLNSAAYNSEIGSGGPAILTVTGSNSQAQLTCQVDSLYIGKTGSGRGIIQVLDGGTVRDGLYWMTSLNTYFGNGGSTHGSLLVEGTDSNYRVEKDSAHKVYFRTNSTLVVRDGGRVWSYKRGSELVFEQGSSLGGDGRLEIGVDCAGMIKPGGTLVTDDWYGVTSGSGTLTVTSNLTLSATALYDVELAGWNVAEYDRVVASNDVVLAGSIAISMIDGFTYSSAGGHRYTVMEVGGTLSGAFSNAANGEWIETANPGETFQVHYGASSQYAANDVVLTTKPTGTVIIIQ